MAPLQIKGLYEIIPLKEFRNTPSVRFHMAQPGTFTKVDAIDRVEHGPHAQSPGKVGTVERPWYYHTSQIDNLMVFTGTRITELYTPEYGKIAAFTVTPLSILQEGELVYDGPAILSWPAHVFHRVASGPEGSLSINLAVHMEGFSLKDNFDIYDVNVQTGEFKVIREGHLDQK